MLCMHMMSLAKFVRHFSFKCWTSSILHLLMAAYAMVNSLAIEMNQCRSDTVWPEIHEVSPQNQGPGEEPQHHTASQWRIHGWAGSWKQLFCNGCVRLDKIGNYIWNMGSEYDFGCYHSTWSLLEAILWRLKNMYDNDLQEWHHQQIYCASIVDKRNVMQIFVYSYKLKLIYGASVRENSQWCILRNISRLNSSGLNINSLSVLHGR